MRRFTNEIFNICGVRLIRRYILLGFYEKMFDLNVFYSTACLFALFLAAHSRLLIVLDLKCALCWLGCRRMSLWLVFGIPFLLPI